MLKIDLRRKYTLFCINMPHLKSKSKDRLSPKTYRKMLMEGASMEEVLRLCFIEKSYTRKENKNRQVEEGHSVYYPLRKTA